MKFTSIAVTTVAIGALGLTGCSSASKALGMSKVTPDEFRVVTKAPLVVPPDYSLRPPAPGEPRPQELQPESAARQALLGQRASETRTDGEKALVSKAGADSSDPLVRYVVDDEFGDIAHKDKSFADKVMFWRKDKAAGPTAAQTGSAQAAPVDPAVEQQRLTSLTGNGTVVIRREGEGHIKLPGL
jgi:hypothetical protein